MGEIPIPEILYYPGDGTFEIFAVRSRVGQFHRLHCRFIEPYRFSVVGAVVAQDAETHNFQIRTVSSEYLYADRPVVPRTRSIVVAEHGNPPGEGDIFYPRNLHQPVFQSGGLARIQVGNGKVKFVCGVETQVGMQHHVDLAGHGQCAAQQNDRDQVLEPDQDFVVNHFGFVPETPADYIDRADPCDDGGRYHSRQGSPAG